MKSLPHAVFYVTNWRQTRIIEILLFGKADVLGGILKFLSGILGNVVKLTHHHFAAMIVNRYRSCREKWIECWSYIFKTNIL
jgi:hypothetical protein